LHESRDKQACIFSHFKTYLRYAALKKGIRLEYVSKLMGHSSIKMTAGYAKIVNDELDKAMEVFKENLPQYFSRRY
jgi:site-specific recombinase XerD